jgi:hypothetical protein
VKKAHLRRFPRPASLRRTPKYASVLGASGALRLDLFDQPLTAVGRQAVYKRSSAAFPSSFVGQRTSMYASLLRTSGRLASKHF